MSADAVHASHHVLSETSRWLTAWDAVLWVALATGAAMYAVGVCTLWRRAGAGQGVTLWQAVAFVVGWLALVGALLSPLDALSDVLFAAHMTQHELIMLVAAPLLVVARPAAAVLWALPQAQRRTIQAWRSPGVLRWWQRATAPVVVLVLHGLVVWIWHLPRLFEAALQSEAVHALQHLMFFWTASLFWWALVHGRYGTLGYGVSVAFVFATAVHSSLLGALLTFAPAPWYPTYQATAPAAGVDALADQQLAGLLMWVPAGVLLMLAGLALFAAWLGALERRAVLHSTTRCSR